MTNDNNYCTFEGEEENIFDPGVTKLKMSWIKSVVIFEAKDKKKKKNIWKKIGSIWTIVYISVPQTHHLNTTALYEICENPNELKKRGYIMYCNDTIHFVF